MSKLGRAEVGPEGPKSRYICLGGWEQTMPAAQLVAPILRLKNGPGLWSLSHWSVPLCRNVQVRTGWRWSRAPSLSNWPVSLCRSVQVRTGWRWSRAPSRGTSAWAGGSRPCRLRSWSLQFYGFQEWMEYSEGRLCDSILIWCKHACIALSLLTLPFLTRICWKVWTMMLIWEILYNAHRPEGIANEGPVRIQYKSLVPIYVFPKMKLCSLLISKTVL